MMGFELRFSGDRIDCSTLPMCHSHFQTVWPDLAKLHLFGEMLHKTIAILEGLICIWKFFYATRQIFIAVNDQILSK